MRLAAKVVLVVAGAFATGFVALFATTFGDCSPRIGIAACEQGKAEALRVGMPVALASYGLFAAAAWRWPRILRWPRP